MLKVIIIVLLILVTIKQKSHFVNYHQIPNFLVYKFKNNLYKFQNNKLTKINYINHPHIEMKNIKKKMIF